MSNSDVLGKSNETPQTTWTIVYGPPKSGKTVVAATASAFCPEELPSKEMIDLEDTVFLQYDLGGTQSLTDVNLSCLVADFSTISTYKELLTKERQVLLDVGQLVADGKVRNIVVDTLTARDHMLNMHFGKTHADDSRAMFGEIKTAHLQFGNRLRGLPAGVKVVILMHAKEVVQDDNNKKMLKARSSQIADIRPALTGSAIDFYLGASDLYWLSAKKVKGQPTERVLETGFSRAHMGGGRGANRLNDIEPANLGKIYKKLGV